MRASTHQLQIYANVSHVFIVFHRDDFLYGSYRAYIKTSDIAGTVAAFYLYKNDTNEIDMEALSYKQNPWQTYLSVKPQIYNPDGSASNLTLLRYIESINPTTVCDINIGEKRENFKLMLLSMFFC